MLRPESLWVGKVHFRNGGYAQAEILHVADNPHDRPPRKLGRSPEAPPDRALAGPKPPRHRLINDRYRRSVFIVASCEFTPSQKGDAQCAEVVRADRAEERHRDLARRSLALHVTGFLGFKARAVVFTGEGRISGSRRCVDSGQRSQAFEEFVVKSGYLAARPLKRVAGWNELVLVFGLR